MAALRRRKPDDEPTDPVGFIHPQEVSHGTPFDWNEGYRHLEETVEEVAASSVEEAPSSAQPASAPVGEVTVIKEARYRGADIVGNAGSLLESKRELPIRPRGPYRPSLVADTVEAGGIVLGAVSLRGARHYDDRALRQDSYAIGLTDDEAWVIAAIADGVSEAKLSHFGADAAVRSAVALTREALASPWGVVDWTAISAGVRAAVRTQAEGLFRDGATRAGEPVDVREISDDVLARQLGTTAEILVVEATRGLPSRRYARVVIAGDGSGFVVDLDRNWIPLSIGKEPGEQGDGVLALPTNPGQVIVQRGELAPGQAVLCMTDGFGDPVGNGNTEVGRYLAAKWATPLSTVELVRTASFVRRQADDDRTAVIVWA